MMSRKIEVIGIMNSAQFLKAGQTPQQRANLTKQAGIPEETVLVLVKRSYRSRLPGMMGIRARFYFKAGVDPVEKLAAFESDQMLLLTSEFVQQAGFKGNAPLPKEVSSTIVNARNLPQVVLW